MKTLLDKIADYFIPKSLGLTSVEMIKARVLINSCFLASTLMILSGLNRYFLTDDFPSSVIAMTFLLCLIPYFIKKVGNFNLVAYLLPTLSLIVLPIITYLRGGLNTTPGLWFAAIPIMSLYFVGPKKGLIYSLLGLVLLIAFLHLHTQKFPFPPTNLDLQAKNLHNGIGLICLFVFITYLTWHYEKSTLENQTRLKLSEQKALQANKTKDIFWANISHEIRTPLNGILGMTNLLLDSRLNKDQGELLQIIKDSAENLNIILSDVIDYSKIETNEIEIQKKPFSLVKTLDQIVQLFQHMANEKGIDLSYSIDSDVPYGILTDENRLRQIIINLVANAIKFTDHGFVKILLERGSRKDVIKFSIEDTGIGIPQNKLEKIFKPFTQVDDSNSRKYGGTGLGLVICKKLVEILGGKIHFESQVGQGSTFSFSIKVMSVQVKGRENDTLFNRPDLHLTKTVALNILVVEDNPVNRRLLVSLLNKNGHDPDIAVNGVEAVNFAKDKFYDLIFMDLQMPEKDGITATKEILEIHSENRPKIVAVTANVLQEDRDKCFEAGMDDFMAKPINNNILISILERYSKQVLEFKDAFMDYEEAVVPRNESKVTRIDSSEHYTTFDAIELLDNFSDDIFVIETIVQQFSEKYGEDLSILFEAIENNDFATIELRAHSLKGSFASLFCKKGLTLSIQLERMGKLADSSEAEDVLNEMKVLCGELVEELETFLNLRQSAA
ncbi:MAG: response regulator [Bacteriovoracaceae bacterium]|nr:response regulator [Bacteriovoracaceae bacterium]